ncbi:MAG: type II toxin-antitoxin system VapC family toxin [Mariprofundaceae bacterium]|nr:type II toxin-antitoxin system VapC family toxin [Mariprofundaceae bacterium]
MIIADTNLIAYLMIPSPKTLLAKNVYLKDSEWRSSLLWRSEFRNVLMLYIRNREISLYKATQMMEMAEKKLGMGLSPSSDDVLALAEQSGCTAYDCEFVALAMTLKVPLLTSDRKVLAAFPDVATSPEEYLV